MATAVLELALITDSHGTTFMLDITVNEAHTWAADVTSDPVEDGSTISDNIVDKPVEVSFTAIVSNAPVQPDIINARAGSTSPATDASSRSVSARSSFTPWAMTPSVIP